MSGPKPWREDTAGSAEMVVGDAGTAEAGALAAAERRTAEGDAANEMADVMGAATADPGSIWAAGLAGCDVGSAVLRGAATPEAYAAGGEGEEEDEEEG